MHKSENKLQQIKMRQSNLNLYENYGVWILGIWPNPIKKEILPKGLVQGEMDICIKNKKYEG